MPPHIKARSCATPAPSLSCPPSFTVAPLFSFSSKHDTIPIAHNNPFSPGMSTSTEPPERVRPRPERPRKTLQHRQICPDEYDIAICSDEYVTPRRELSTLSPKGSREDMVRIHNSSLLLGKANWGEAHSRSQIRWKISR